MASWASFARQVQAFDLRFHDKDDEASFKASLESKLLGWMLVGMIISSCFSLVAIFEEESSDRRDGCTSNDIDNDIKGRIVICQLIMWTIAPAVLGAVIGLRVWLRWFDGLDWERVATGIMMYGSLAVVLGQKYYMALFFGRDPAEFWCGNVSFTVDAWVFLGIDTMTTAAAFFLPLRSVVTWLVPFTGLATYFVVKVSVDSDLRPLSVLMKLLIMVALSYLACQGAAGTEKHLRDKWKAVRQVKQSADTIEKQAASIQEQGREIQEKEAEIQATTELMKSLQTVTKALCDIIVNLGADLRILRSDCDAYQEVFFEDKVEGRRFTDFLNRVDQERFADCAARAAESQLPVCIPVTLYREHTTSEVHLVLVHRGHAAQTRYMLGIRVDVEGPRSSQGGAPPQQDHHIANFTDSNNHSDMVAVLPGMPNASAAPTHAVPRDINRIDEDTESNFSGASPRRTSQRRFVRTSARSKARTIRMVLKRWYVPVVDNSYCCPFHAVVDHVEDALDFLRRLDCDPAWAPLPEQCPNCTCMFQGNRCAVCGLSVGDRAGELS